MFNRPAKQPKNIGFSGIAAIFAARRGKSAGPIEQAATAEDASLQAADGIRSADINSACLSFMCKRGSVMSIAAQVIFEHMEQSGAAEARAVEQIEQLAKDYDCITAARIVIARPQLRHHKGDDHQVRIHLTISGAPDIVVTHEPEDAGNHDDIHVTLDRAFKAARRQLRDFSKIQQGHVKHHAVAANQK